MRRYNVEIYDNEGYSDGYVTVVATDNLDTAYVIADEQREPGRISVRIYDTVYDTYLYY